MKKSNLEQFLDSRDISPGVNLGHRFLKHLGIINKELLVRLQVLNNLENA